MSRINVERKGGSAVSHKDPCRAHFLAFCCRKPSSGVVSLVPVGHFDERPLPSPEPSSIWMSYMDHVSLHIGAIPVNVCVEICSFVKGGRAKEVSIFLARHALV